MPTVREQFVVGFWYERLMICRSVRFFQVCIILTTRLCYKKQKRYCHHLLVVVSVVVCVRLRASTSEWPARGSSGDNIRISTTIYFWHNLQKVHKRYFSNFPHMCFISITLGWTIHIPIKSNTNMLILIILFKMKAIFVHVFLNSHSRYH